jgi:hypothetical protein
LAPKPNVGIMDRKFELKVKSFGGPRKARAVHAYFLTEVWPLGWASVIFAP